MSPVAYRKPKRPHRIYVKVNSDFDSTGYMQPRSITWDDGRTFRIDSVKDFRPASSMGESIPGDCYTVVIRGKLRHLFFERANPHFPSRFGRWFVETMV
jgi:hypothetical protein